MGGSVVVVVGTGAVVVVGTVMDVVVVAVVVVHTPVMNAEGTAVDSDVAFPPDSGRPATPQKNSKDDDTSGRAQRMRPLPTLIILSPTLIVCPASDDVNTFPRRLASHCRGVRLTGISRSTHTTHGSPTMVESVEHCGSA